MSPTCWFDNCIGARDYLLRWSRWHLVHFLTCSSNCKCLPISQDEPPSPIITVPPLMVATTWRPFRKRRPPMLQPRWRPVSAVTIPSARLLPIHQQLRLTFDEDEGYVNWQFVCIWSPRHSFSSYSSVRVRLLLNRVLIKKLQYCPY